LGGGTGKNHRSGPAEGGGPGGPRFVLNFTLFVNARGAPGPPPPYDPKIFSPPTPPGERGRDGGAGGTGHFRGGGGTTGLGFVIPGFQLGGNADEK